MPIGTKKTFSNYYWSRLFWRVNNLKICKLHSKVTSITRYWPSDWRYCHKDQTRRSPDIKSLFASSFMFLLCYVLIFQPWFYGTRYICKAALCQQTLIGEHCQNGEEQPPITKLHGYRQIIYHVVESDYIFDDCSLLSISNHGYLRSSKTDKVNHLVSCHQWHAILTSNNYIQWKSTYFYPSLKSWIRECKPYRYWLHVLAA